MEESSERQIKAGTRDGRDSSASSPRPPDGGGSFGTHEQALEIYFRRFQCGGVAGPSGWSSIRDNLFQTNVIVAKGETGSRRHIRRSFDPEKSASLTPLGCVFIRNLFGITPLARRFAESRTSRALPVLGVVPYLGSEVKALPPPSADGAQACLSIRRPFPPLPRPDDASCGLWM